MKRQRIDRPLMSAQNRFAPFVLHELPDMDLIRHGRVRVLITRGRKRGCYHVFLLVHRRYDPVREVANLSFHLPRLRIKEENSLVGVGAKQGAVLQKPR